MKIYKIALKDFRAFKGECIIELKDGRNLLLYGENGSGKSSLYQALNLFLSASPQKFSVYKNIFVTTDEGFVKLEIGDGTNPTKPYEWESTTHPSKETLILDASKTKGFLDYKALLETHFIHRDFDSVNIFPLMINKLLANIKNPVSQIVFEDEWRLIKNRVKARKNEARIRWINRQLSDFSSGLVSLLADVIVKSNEILNLFEQNVSISLALPSPGLGYDSATKKITNQTISLTATYYGKPIADHHRFLNEARLSAIAISIYLGALLLNPPSQLRVLFFDDVLIGLDISNRLPLLNVLEKFFADWQVILATYDRVWFEMVRQRVETIIWQCDEIYCSKTGECDVPIYVPDRDYLKVAKKHLDSNDDKAAAIYIRSAYEHSIKHFCDRWHLPIRYYENQRHQDSDEFWQVVKKQKLKETGTDLLSAALIKNIELFRTAVMNQLSHTVPINLVRKEVEEAYKTVQTLQETLQQVKRGELE